MTHPPQDEDLALRQQLRTGLAQTATDDSEALQQRVLAQWAQRHAQARVEASATLHAGQGTLKGSPRVWAWGAACAGLLVLALLQAWSRHQEAVVEELAQPDVLSLISLDEL